MKTVLVITYNFPPDGGPAVQRVTKFVKYLRYYGYNAIILTSKHKKEITDNTLIKDIPEGTKIYHSVDLGDYCPGELRNKILKKYFVPDKQKFWEITAMNTFKKILEKENIDIIFSTSPPHSVHLIAKKIKEKYNIPWVADFRDEWTKNPSFKDFENKSKNKLLEEQVVRYADHIITCTESAKNNFERLYDIKNISVIYNGYDSEDFREISEKDVNIPDKSDCLNIMYFGRLSSLKTNPEDLFEAMNNLKMNNLLRLKFHVIGNNNKNDWLKKYPELEENIIFYSYKNHNECLEFALSADALLLLATNMNETEFFPAKVFEYIKLRKPIFAIISKKGELSEFLDNYGNKYISFEGNTKEIKNNLINLMQKKRNNQLQLSQNFDFIKNYDRKNQTENLVTIFNLLGKDE